MGLSLTTIQPQRGEITEMIYKVYDLCRTFGADKIPYPKRGAAPLASVFRPFRASKP